MFKHNIKHLLVTYIHSFFKGMIFLVVYDKLSLFLFNDNAIYYRRSTPNKYLVQKQINFRLYKWI